MTTFVWTCPQCARSVPNRLDVCRCGCARPGGSVAEEQGPPAGQPPVVPPPAHEARVPPVAAVSQVTPAAAPVPSRPSVPEAPPRRSGFSPVLVAAAAALVLLMTGAAGFWMSRERVPRRAPEPASAAAARVPVAESALPDAPPLAEAPPATAPDIVTPASAEPMALLSTEEIVTRSMPAVVTVETRYGIGSGFFVAVDTVVTNAHVVSGSAMVTLKRSGGYRRAARVDDQSTSIDLAILKVDVPDLDQIVLPLAGPGDVHVGAEVIAIGSPLGLANTVTRGIVSSLREIDGVRMVQTDAAINPGNSGGPLFDRYGRVLGVNTMKLAARGVESMAFAVSIEYVRKMLGAGFVPKTEGDRGREIALRDFTENVRVLARTADTVEGNWKSFRSYCAVEKAPAPVEREWFGLWEGEPPPIRASESCRSWQAYFKTNAIKIHDALKRYQLAARVAGVGPDRQRIIERRHNMVWPGWE